MAGMDLFASLLFQSLNRSSAIMIVALAIAGAIALPAVIAILGFTTAGVAAGTSSSELM
jgi:hypothetical protein